MSDKVAATFHPHTAPTVTLTPELLDRLRNTRGEHLEGMEIVSIPRAQLDALIDAARMADPRIARLSTAVRELAGWQGVDIADLIEEEILEEGDLA